MAKVLRILEQVKLSTVSQVFTDLFSNSPKRSLWFSPGYKGRGKMFYFLNIRYVEKLCKLYFNTRN